MNLKERLLQWMRNNKALLACFAIIAILSFLLFVFVAPSILTSRPVNDMGLTGPAGSVATDRPGSAVTGLEGIARDTAERTGEAEIEINEARVNIESEDAEREAEEIRSITERYDGLVERSGKTETNTALIVSMTTRVPQENFEQFVEEIKDSFEVEGYDTHNFIVDVQRQVDELTILNNALEEYADIREEIREMPAGQERVNLLMDVTNKEEELARRIRALERDLGNQERRGEMSTVNITLEERLRADLWPEDIGNRFRDSMQNALDSVADSLIAITTQSIALFFAVIKWIVYAAIVLIPVILVYKGGKNIYRRYSSSNNPHVKDIEE